MPLTMPRIEDFDYFLPPELVAQFPLGQRDASRLLALPRDGGEIRHAGFRDLTDWLDEHDVLVVNDTRVFPARLTGHKDSGGKVELLLHHLPVAEANGAVPRPARARATHRGRLKVGQVLNFGAQLTATVLALPAPGVVEVRFIADGGDPVAAVLAAGDVPLPPYIHRPAAAADRETYQTVFAAPAGAVACPTAGLHFTGTVLEHLARRGVEIVSLTLHVGPGTFLPVRHADYTRHRMLPEYFELSEAAAARLNAARAAGKRLLAVGTTSVRVLEHCASPQGFKAQQGWCDLFIYPGYQFRAVDRLLTNFHLPKSTLLLLVSAFVGRDLILRAYEEAVREKYRFYSYGDCMLIL
jgi:S-adenosylmethionine:tRNA ribosyltransferase-isomerase